MSETDTHKHDSFEAAREQAAEFMGFTASERIVTPRGEVFEIPNPSLLDDDQLPRYDALQLEVESWEREPDEYAPDERLPDTVDADGNVTKGEVVKGKLIRRGELLEPNRKTVDGNTRLVENYHIQLAKAIFGDRYEAFRAAGGRAADVTLVWRKMGLETASRRDADPKSDGGGQAMEAVADAD
jgi:hypothetical protein